ncbi:MAG: Glycosyl transferase family 2 [Microgenomates group bacterium GW2011_GWA2_46_16]|nr:MAG: Glycosyl transferase family 2 [Microgenomates group bacterium GW2011_GWA2_46_16]
MKRRAVSIIIVAYNSSNKIDKLLKSLILNCKYINEVIVIENNSPDRNATHRKCEKYSNKIKLTFVENENVGFGRSCNKGASLSKGDQILFLNPDTELKTSSIQILLNHMELTHADIIGGKTISYKGEIHGSVVRAPNIAVGLFEFTNLGKLFNIKKWHKYFYYEDRKMSLTDEDQLVDAVSGAYLLITRKAFQRLNGFDMNIYMYLEDVDLGIRANEMGMRVVYCPHSEIWHIGGASSNDVHKIHHKAWYDSRKYYFKKHFGVLTNAILQPIFVTEEFVFKFINRIRE